MRSCCLVLAATVVAVAWPGQASAHDLRLVVKVPPDTPEVLLLEAGFDDETPAEEAKLVITDAAGTVVAEGKTDARGLCKLARPVPGKYVATVDALGHKDKVEFEIVGAADAGTAATEYRGWRLDRTLGLVIGVGGLLAFSGGYWLLRRRKV
ncbi:MAG: carboxypeptidase-like regulatory domain-containing protein [Gemmataceae bacterium]